MNANSKIKINLDSLRTRKEWLRHKVKDGHNIYRIGPPHGQNSNGYVSHKWQIIWGLVDPESGRARPFASSMTSEKRCPVTEYVAELVKKSESLKIQYMSQGLDEETVKERLAPLNTLVSDLKPKTMYVYNAIDKSGVLGLLELKSTAHKKMKAEMAQYVADYNQDPTSLNSDSDDSGVWFDITRTGLGRDTVYDVKKCQVKTKKIGAAGFSYDDDLSPLPESIVSNYESQAYDLTAVYQIKTYDELNEILQANMANLVENCPEADLGVTLTLTGSSPTTVTHTVKAPIKGTKPVTTRFDAGDDTGSTARGSTVIDDDFLASANSLLDD